MAVLFKSIYGVFLIIFQTKSLYLNYYFICALGFLCTHREIGCGGIPGRACPPYFVCANHFAMGITYHSAIITPFRVWSLALLLLPLWSPAQTTAVGPEMPVHFGRSPAGLNVGGGLLAGFPKSAVG
ncbi:MAG: hypothetical protein M3Y54_19780 [Bacteroidota bacterium]|nr:hypothetical protein [Bacteroidota bacterium]